ncbi:MAG: hypothetical protein WD845_18210 [Pirellulales bacterium]
MRRSFLMIATGLLCAMLADQPAVAQGIDGDAPPTHVLPARRVTVTGAFPSAPVAPPTAPAAPPEEAPGDAPANESPADGGDRGGRDRDERRHGHHRHREHGNGPIFLWPPIIYPWPGNVGYIPGFPYDNLGSPYYFDPTQSGWSPVGRPVAALPAAKTPAPADPLPDNDTVRSKIRTTNAQTKARAGKFVGYGDANFGKQSYLSAAERYKDASRIAPDMAEPFFRQGFAFVAMGNYESAARAFRRGLVIRSDWRHSPFRLDQIYDADPITKTAHLEGLAKAVEANPLDADLLMLLGMMLYFDGQAERSGTFFSSAAQLGGNDERLLEHFLPQPGPAGAPRPDGQAKPGGKLVF